MTCVAAVRPSSFFHEVQLRVTRSEDGGVVKSDGSKMSKGQLDLSKTVRSNVGEDMTNDQGRTELKAGSSGNECGSIKGDEASIRRPSLDGSASRIGRAHFESGSDGSTEMSAEEVSLEKMLAEYCDDR